MTGNEGIGAAKCASTGRLETHLHTAYSDGALDEEALIERLYAIRSQSGALEVVAITDHNSMNGYEPVLRANADYCTRHKVADPIRMVLGTEFDAHGYNGVRTHLLGYFPHFEPDRLDTHLKPIAERFVSRNRALAASPRAMFRVLSAIFEELGIRHPQELDPDYAERQILERMSQARRRFLDRKLEQGDRLIWEPSVSGKARRDVLRDSYGLPSMALQFFSARSTRKAVTTRALVDLCLSLNQDLTEDEIGQAIMPAFGILLGFSDQQKKKYPQAYSAFGKMDTSNGLAEIEEVVKAIKEAGGYAVLAHPSETYLKKGLVTVYQLRGFIRALAVAGLDGVECCYPQQPEESITGLAELCEDAGLAVFGGCDYHGKYPGEEDLVGKFSVDNSLDRLFGVSHDR